MYNIKKLKKNKSSIIYIYKSIYVLIFIYLIMASYNWSTYNNRLQIKLIQFSNTKIINNEIYKSLLHGIIKENIFKINISEINKVIEDHPYVKAARISNHYPNKIKIEIIEREPIAILQINPNIMIDKDGVILPDIDNFKNFDLPTLTNFNFKEDSSVIGERIKSIKIHECIQWLADIEKNYNYLYQNLSELKITSSEEIELILSDYPTKIYLGQSKFENRIKILKEFEKTLKPKNISDYSYLDMRYENQIVVKERHS